jgi:rhodanese-related sulfurtransferase/predicted transcriptional regulator
LYPQFARIGQALASEKRLELVDLLAQAPRHVDALSQETGMSVANVSQHLQVLRSANLVEAERQGNMTVYKVSDPAVVQLWLALRGVAEARLAEVREIARDLPGRDANNVVSRDEVKELLKSKAVLLDVRPAHEFEAGHLRGAINIPMNELADRMDELPRDRQIITYCRGEYCLLADEAIELLSARGFVASRLEGGWPEWLSEGRPTTAASARGSR